MDNHTDDGSSVLELVDNAVSGDWDNLLSAAARAQTRDRNWQLRAACTEEDPELFFPHGDSPHESNGLRNQHAVERALEVCARCPFGAQVQCLRDALEQGDEYGIRGGLSANERQPLHVAWSERVDETRVRAALSGTNDRLTRAERRQVLRRYVDERGHSAAQVARGLGVTRGALAWHAYGLRKRRATDGLSAAA